MCRFETFYFPLVAGCPMVSMRGDIPRTHWPHTRFGGHATPALLPQGKEPSYDEPHVCEHPQVQRCAVAVGRAGQAPGRDQDGPAADSWTARLLPGQDGR